MKYTYRTKEITKEMKHIQNNPQQKIGGTGINSKWDEGFRCGLSNLSPLFTSSLTPYLLYSVRKNNGF